MTLQVFIRQGVTPYAGVWIETWLTALLMHLRCVTPYAGVWIETKGTYEYCTSKMSLLMRECGLKHQAERTFDLPTPVTPYAGVWIETYRSV